MKMLKEEIKKLIDNGQFPEKSRQRELVETHISWIILCDDFVYKIKKPVQYSFLDFSTIALRKYYCEREIELNRRMSKDIYLEVLPVSLSNEDYKTGQPEGIVIDYAVKMRKLDPEKQMDVLLEKDEVRAGDIKELAKCIAAFHERAGIIHKKDVLDLKRKFNELKEEKDFLSENMGNKLEERIDRAIDGSDTFLNMNKNLLEERQKAGFFRDCHGDLHTRNIFLLPAPQPFDCIEFNDDYREIDVLNEVAFLCMDLDAMDKKDLSHLFIKNYNLLLPVMRNSMERQLFIYYKSYRANVRAKVNSLRASGSSDGATKAKALKEVEKYLQLMESYMDKLDLS